MTHGITLSKSMCPWTQDERTRISMIPYASTIGSIMYSMICTRPNVLYAQSFMSRYQSDSSEGYWVAVKNILKYLRRTKDIFLIYGDRHSDLHAKGYTNANLQSDRNDSNSQSGYVFTLNGGEISWKNSKQETTFDSTTKAKYITTFEAAKEAVWIRIFILELGVVPNIID